MLLKITPNLFIRWVTLWPIMLMVNGSIHLRFTQSILPLGRDFFAFFLFFCPLLHLPCTNSYSLHLLSGLHHPVVEDFQESFRILVFGKPSVDRFLQKRKVYKSLVTKIINIALDDSFFLDSYQSKKLIFRFYIHEYSNACLLQHLCNPFYCVT